MKHTEIEAFFTKKVNEFIMDGYIFSTTTMSGHQGEIAKVDVKKGNETIRIMLTSESSWDDEGTVQKTTLTVGRAMDKIRSSRPFDTMATTIWNDRLDIIEERVWYSVDSSADCFFEDKDEILAQHEKQMKRWRIREAMRELHNGQIVTSDKAKEIVLPFVRRQRGEKRAKAEDIESVKRWFADQYSEMHYTITMKNGKSYKLA